MAMRVRAFVHYTGFSAEMMTSKGNPKKPFRDVLKKSLISTGRLWRRKMLKSHFTRTAHSRYGIPTRGARYNKAKRLLFGHNRPLDFTGVSKAKILGDRKAPWASVKGGSRKEGRKGMMTVSVRIHADDYYFKSPRKIGGPRPLQETVALTLSELSRLNAHFMRQFNRHMESAKRVTKRVA